MGWFNKYSDGVGAQRRAEKKYLLGAERHKMANRMMDEEKVESV
jgi:hypothetical protein